MVCCAGDAGRRAEPGCAAAGRRSGRERCRHRLLRDGSEQRRRRERCQERRRFAKDLELHGKRHKGARQYARSLLLLHSFYFTFNCFSSISIIEIETIIFRFLSITLKARFFAVLLECFLFDLYLPILF